MDTFEAIAKRKSIRSYKQEQVPKETVDKIIEAGNKAPLAGQIAMRVITNKDILAKADQETFEAMQNSGVPFMVERSSIPGYRPLYSAPVLVIVAADPERGMANAAGAAALMTVAATDLGIGSCYVAGPVRTFGGDAYKEALNLPEGMIPLAGVLLGVTDDPHLFERQRAAVDVAWIE